MTYSISKRFDFSASHVLSGLPEDHPCSRLHGHNYAVEVVLAADVLDPTGFIVDYRELDTVKRFIDGVLDHHHLNDLVTFNPTAERLAEWMAQRFENLLSAIPGYNVLPAQAYGGARSGWWLEVVRVSETPKTWAEVHR